MCLAPGMHMAFCVYGTFSKQFPLSIFLSFFPPGFPFWLFVAPTLTLFQTGTVIHLPLSGFDKCCHPECSFYLGQAPMQAKQRQALKLALWGGYQPGQSIHHSSFTISPYSFLCTSNLHQECALMSSQLPLHWGGGRGKWVLKCHSPFLLKFSSCILHEAFPWLWIFDSILEFQKSWCWWFLPAYSSILWMMEFWHFPLCHFWWGQCAYTSVHL